MDGHKPRIQFIRERQTTQEHDTGVHLVEFLRRIVTVSKDADNFPIEVVLFSSFTIGDGSPSSFDLRTSGVVQVLSCNNCVPKLHKNETRLLDATTLINFTLDYQESYPSTVLFKNCHGIALFMDELFGSVDASQVQLEKAKDYEASGRS